MKCKNCGNSFDGKFCNLCGQHIRVEKLTLPNFLEEISDSVFQVNRGLFYTIKSLAIRPGHAIREFLNGQRKYYFKPIAFILVLSTFYFLITKILGATTLLENAISGFRRGAEDKSDFLHNAVILEFSTEWFINNFAYSNLLLIPALSIASYMAFYGRKNNFLEHIVINSYIGGQQTIFYSLFAIFDFVTKQNDLGVTLAFIISIVYRFWAFIQFYQTKNKIYTSFRLMLTYILFYFIIMIFLGVIVFTAIILKEY
ncbi:DUF3667 domain-containing protein [Spongiivirga citrea]|uniref:DUF3667 domain-containing protein n=1 Tax=Spongiivirga citrea TaxID=1481457 RepID=A0A6M0CME2_9FLAO|nr:DUF3667 domain-containing protein [Spongiivirga citrea]NER19108.1 DUF3667 domain-containing protein [Spongiivirga citrea]